jgi:hypothetical protein
LGELRSFQLPALVGHLHVIVVVGPPRPEQAQDVRDRVLVVLAQGDGVEAPGAEPGCPLPELTVNATALPLHVVPGRFRRIRMGRPEGRDLLLVLGAGEDVAQEESIIVPVAACKALRARRAPVDPQAYLPTVGLTFSPCFNRRWVGFGFTAIRQSGPDKSCGD